MTDATQIRAEHDSVPPQTGVVQGPVIAGGGMVGLATAVALAGIGLPVTVIERDDPAAKLSPCFDGRTSALALGTQQWLARLGVWQDMAPHGCAISDIHILDREARAVHYDHRLLGAEPMGFVVENRHILAALLEAVRRQPLITLRSGLSVSGIDLAPERLAQIRLSDGTTLLSPLLLACDGKSSRLRDMARISCHVTSYRQTAIVCTVAHEKPHDGLAIERFLPAGPFAVLPMVSGLERDGGTHRSSIVWSEAEEAAEGLLALDDDDFISELSRRFTDVFGKIRLAGPRFRYPLTCMKAERLVGSRFALLGDAGHGIHPIAGQGVNLGFRDAMELAGQLEEALRLGLDMGGSSLLRRYEQARHFDVDSMVLVTDRLNWLFRQSHPLISASRRLGMGVVEHTPALKRIFMKHAMGVLLPIRAEMP